MPYVNMNCAVGSAKAVRLECLPVIALSPDDDSVDTNTVVIFGTGTITSFGPCSRIISMSVAFEPNPDSPIYLRDGLLLRLLVTGQQRVIRKNSFGTYWCDGDNKWVETYFAESTGSYVLINELEERVRALEKKALGNA